MLDISRDFIIPVPRWHPQAQQGRRSLVSNVQIHSTSLLYETQRASIAYDPDSLGPEDEEVEPCQEPTTSE